MRVAGVAFAIGLAAACSSNPPPIGSAPPPTAPAPGETGRVETKTFHSDALGVDKHVVVYLPAGYDADTAKRWPVFYYLHGLGGNETNWIKGGKLDAVADAMKLGAIVVMPDGDNNFYIDSPMPQDYDACIAIGKGMFSFKQPREATCVRHSRYETYIVKDLLGWVDRSYRTIAARDGRGIAGLSMGGFGALQLGMRFSDQFAAAASHSGVDALLFSGPVPYVAGKPDDVKLLTDVAKWGTEFGAMGEWIRGVFGSDIARWRAHDPAALAAKLAPGTLALYLDCGTEDVFALHHGAAYVHDVLVKRGVAHEYFLGPGGHDFAFWTARLPHSLGFLRDHVTGGRTISM